MKKNNKGFTLVELIVVLVILAILAAILVPALLGYIDRAREKQLTTNAEAALVAAQGLMADAYGAYEKPADFITADKIQNLTDINEHFSYSWKVEETYDSSSLNKKMYKIKYFAYYSETADKTAYWSVDNKGNWTVINDADKTGDKTKDASLIGFTPEDSDSYTGATNNGSNNGSNGG